MSFRPSPQGNGSVLPNAPAQTAFGADTCVGPRFPECPSSALDAARKNLSYRPEQKISVLFCPLLRPREAQGAQPQSADYLRPLWRGKASHAAHSRRATLSVEAEKTSPAGKTGRDHEVGDPSVVVEFDGAAVDPLTEASAALDDKDYATAQRLFAAIGRKDVAEAIKDALAALDRKDYATAQGLFEAFGQKGAAAAQVKGSVQASPASPKPAAWAGGSMASDSRNEARQKPVTSPFEVIPLADAAYRRPLPQAEKAKSRRLKPLLAGTGRRKAGSGRCPR